MPECAILDYGNAVACERIGRYFRSVSKQTAQPQVVEGAPALDDVAKEEGTGSAAEEGREPFAMQRPGIDGRHQHQPPQAGFV